MGEEDGRGRQNLANEPEKEGLTNLNRRRRREERKGGKKAFFCSSLLLHFPHTQRKRRKRSKSTLSLLPLQSSFHFVFVSFWSEETKIFSSPSPLGLANFSPSFLTAEDQKERKEEMVADG